MFRRRPFRRRPLMRRALRKGVEQVEQAERLFQDGHYAEAADLFARLAQGAARRRMMEPAGNLHRRAAVAYLEAGRPDDAVEQVKRSVGAFVRARRPGLARETAAQAVARLREKGYGSYADALERELRERAAARGPLGRGPRPKLPAKCSSCGGPLKADEVHWVGPDRVECPYCGSVVTAEA